MTFTDRMACHDCGKEFTARYPERDGAVVILCPHCQHEHCRIIAEGRVTEARWDSRNRRYYSVQSPYLTFSNATTVTGSAIAVTSGTCTAYSWDTWSASGTR
jgi:DNA-directed RNA polymerase subunit RPC12/RpoP